MQGGIDCLMGNEKDDVCDMDHQLIGNSKELTHESHSPRYDFHV